MKLKDYTIIALVILCAYLYFNRPTIEKVKEVTVVEERIVRDTIQTEIKSKPITRYITKENEIVKDSIIYMSDTSLIKVNEYNEVLKNHFVRANIKVLTTGELKGLTGDFEVKEKTVTITRDNYIIKSNLYLGSSILINNSEFDFMVNADYAIKNKYIVKGGYSPINKSFLIGFGIKI